MGMTWRFRCACWGTFSSLVVAVLVGHCWSAEAHVTLRITEGVVATLLVLSSLIAFHISSLRCSESHTLTTLLLSYWWHQGEWLATPFISAKANRMWRHPREAQEDLIRELTRRHAQTEYGRRNRLGEIRSMADLRSKHPLTTYDHFRGYIQRLADGEEGVFLDEKPVRFGITSGTTGAGKKIPYSESFWESESFALKLVRLAVYQGLGRPSPVQKRCSLYVHPKFSVTEAGLSVASYTFFKEKERSIVILPEQSSPPPAFTITHEPSAMYVHMLFAIADSNLAMLSAMFTSQLYRALTALETHWPAMLEDLAAGAIGAEIPLDPEVRRALRGHLRPDPARAARLRREFERGFDGIVKRIWPHLRVLDGIDALGFRERLEKTYARGLMCRGTFYGSTESGTPAVNVRITAETPAYVLLPRIAAYEFIPEDKCLEREPATLLLDEVKVGGRYELVMTTRTGLYRYRSGDIVQVTEFHEQCPVFRMLYRICQCLDLVSEKINTQVVDAAIQATMGSWPGVQLVDWTCAESPIHDTDSSELYYIVFIEIDGEETDFPEERMMKFDDYLQQHQFVYKNYRCSGIISAPHMRLVGQGAFADLKDFTVAHSTASANQYKTPRKLRTRELVEWMMTRVVN